MEKNRNLTVPATWGWLGLIGLEIGLIFYKVLLAMVTWNLYVADYTFTVGYWQMFLITVVIGFVFGGTGTVTNELKVKINKVANKKINLGIEEFLKIITIAYFKTTLVFGILYGIYLLI